MWSKWGNKVDLWFRDHHSGRLRWRVTPAPYKKSDTEFKGEVYFLKITTGRKGCRRNYLSVPDKGSLVDLWKDAGKNQKWHIKGFGKQLMKDNASSKSCGVDSILGHKKHAYSIMKSTGAATASGCGAYKSMPLGVIENLDGQQTLGYSDYRNLYYEELKFNPALLHEFKTYLRSQKMSGRFALVNGYLDYKWGSGKATVVKTCHSKHHGKNFQLIVGKCHKYGKQ